MADDPYKSTVRGKLVLKGSKDAGVSKKKHKKKKSKLTEDQKEALFEAAQEAGDDKEKVKSKVDNDGKDKAKAAKKSPDPPSTKTEAEKIFEESRRKRVTISRLEQAKREGYKSHQEKVQEFNNKLARMTDHNDMPKIGPG